MRTVYATYMNIGRTSSPKYNTVKSTTLTGTTQHSANETIRANRRWLILISDREMALFTVELVLKLFAL